MRQIFIQQDSQRTNCLLRAKASNLRIVPSGTDGKLSWISSTGAPRAASSTIVSARMRVPFITGLPATFPGTSSTSSQPVQSTKPSLPHCPLCPILRRFSIPKLTNGDPMPGQKPAFRFLTKPEGSDKFTELGAAWKTSKADVFSVSLDLEGTGEKVSFIMVPADRPKPATKPVPQQKPAA